MARRRKTEDIVDGFTTIKAAQRAAGKGTRVHREAGAEPPPQPPAPPPEPKAVPQGDRKRIGHTAQPARHDIVCYECGFSFLLTGQLRSTYCPKCRTILEAGEQVIDSEWTGVVKTIGVVKIAGTGVFRDGRIAASNVVLAGRIAGGKVFVSGRFEVCPGGTFKPEAVDARNVVIGGGAVVEIGEELLLKNVEVYGELRASINASGIVTIKSGGLLRGRLTGHHLVVEDGGGLNAAIAVTPETAPVAGGRAEMPAAGGLVAQEHRRSAA